MVSNYCVNSHNDRVIIDNVGSSSSKLSYDLSNVGHKVNYNINTKKNYYSNIKIASSQNNSTIINEAVHNNDKNNNVMKNLMQFQI